MTSLALNGARRIVKYNWYLVRLGIYSQFLVAFAVRGSAVCARYVAISLRSRREWVPVQTSVPNAIAKSFACREKNGEESS